MEVKGQAAYLDDSQVAVLGVCAQVKDVPLYVHSGWKNKNRALSYKLKPNNWHIKAGETQQNYYY